MCNNLTSFDKLCARVFIVIENQSNEHNHNFADAGNCIIIIGVFCLLFV